MIKNLLRNPQKSLLTLLFGVLLVKVNFGLAVAQSFSTLSLADKDDPATYPVIEGYEVGQFATSTTSLFESLNGGLDRQSALDAVKYNNYLRVGKVIRGSTLHRKVVDARNYPWSAIGRLHVSVTPSINFQCTGSMIGERIVLTAAHCIYIKKLKKWAKPSLINFVAGFQRNDYLVASRAERYIVSPDFDGSKGVNANNLVNDWALVVLKDPVGRGTGYLAWKSLDPKEARRIKRSHQPLAIAGYPRDRRYVISLDDDCEFAGYFNRNKLLGHRCKILNGDSGAPLGILDDKGNFTVVGVNSAAGRDNFGNGLNSAVPINNFKPQLIKLIEESERTDKLTFLSSNQYGTIGRERALPLSVDVVIDDIIE